MNRCGCTNNNGCLNNNGCGCNNMATVNATVFNRGGSSLSNNSIISQNEIGVTNLMTSSQATEAK